MSRQGMRTIRFGGPGTRANLLHVEVPGAILNIRPGLRSADGIRVTAIEIIPDASDGWKCLDEPMPPQGMNVRVGQGERQAPHVPIAPDKAAAIEACTKAQDEAIHALAQEAREALSYSEPMRNGSDQGAWLPAEVVEQLRAKARAWSEASNALVRAVADSGWQPKAEVPLKGVRK